MAEVARRRFAGALRSWGPSAGAGNGPLLREGSSPDVMTCRASLRPEATAGAMVASDPASARDPRVSGVWFDASIPAATMAQTPSPAGGCRQEGNQEALPKDEQGSEGKAEEEGQAMMPSGAGEGEKGKHFALVSMDLKGSTRAKAEIHRTAKTADQEQEAVKELIRLASIRFFQVVEGLLNQDARGGRHAFGDRDIFLIKALGDEFWFCVELAASGPLTPEHNRACLRLLEVLTPGGHVRSVPPALVADNDDMLGKLLELARAEDALSWKITVDLLSDAVDCGGIMLAEFWRRPLVAVQDNRMVPVAETPEEIRKLVERIAPVIAIPGVESDPNKAKFACRFDPVGWEVDRFHRLKGECFNCHEDYVLVGSALVHSLMVPGSDLRLFDPDTKRLVIYTPPHFHHYEAIPGAFSPKGLTELIGDYQYFRIRPLNIPVRRKSSCSPGGAVKGG